MANLESVKVINGKDTDSLKATIEAGFGTNNTLTLHVADATKTTAFTFMDNDSINGAGTRGKQYSFVNGGYAVGNSVTLLSGEDTVSLDNISNSSKYSSVTVDYESAVIQGKAKATNNITLAKTGSSVSGGEKADTLIANATNATLRAVKATTSSSSMKRA